MGIGVVLGRIPWREILKIAPALVESARKLYESLGKRGVQKTIEGLQSNDAQQAELISKLAVQTQGLSNGLRVLAARVTLLLCVSVAAFLTAIFLLLKELVSR